MSAHQSWSDSNRLCSFGFSGLSAAIMFVTQLIQWKLLITKTNSKPWRATDCCPMMSRRLRYAVGETWELTKNLSINCTIKWEGLNDFSGALSVCDSLIHLMFPTCPLEVLGNPQTCVWLWSKQALWLQSNGRHTVWKSHFVTADYLSLSLCIYIWTCSCYSRNMLLLVIENALITHVFTRCRTWGWASIRTTLIVSVAMATALLVDKNFSLESVSWAGSSSAWLLHTACCSSWVRAVGQSSASTSRAARSPDCIAPLMYPHHCVAVSVPAQWIL